MLRVCWNDWHGEVTGFIDVHVVQSGHIMNLVGRAAIFVKKVALS